MTDDDISLQNQNYSRSLLGDGRGGMETPSGEGGDAERVCGCRGCWDGIPVTNNTRALLVMTALFAAMSIGQYFAAAAVGSQALKADVVSMAADAASYLGNILGESARHPARRVVTRLFFSMMSLFLLLCFNTVVFVESVGIIKGGSGEAPSDIEGIIVISFAGLGLVLDLICLYAYYYFARKDADAEHQALIKQKNETAGTIDEEHRTDALKKPEINMLSALLHVSADLFRSTSTFVLGILMVSGALTRDQQDMGDAILAVIIGCTIYAGGAYALYEWCVALRARFAKDVDISAEEGEAEDVFL